MIFIFMVEEKEDFYWWTWIKPLLYVQKKLLKNQIYVYNNLEKDIN